MIALLNTKPTGLALQDFAKKTKILPTLKLLKESQNWNEEQIYTYRLAKLQLLVEHSYNHVPYYTELFNTHGILPQDIKTLQDIKKIPILTKELARINQKKLVSENTNFRYVKKGKTGGTTGVPLIYFSDTNNRSFSWASFYRWYNWIGIERADRVMTLWGAKTILKPSFKTKIIENSINWSQNKKTINTFSINDKSTPAVYSQIIKYNPIILKGYLSAIILIAKYMQKNKLQPNKNLKAISTTTETLLPIYRDLLSQVFSVPVYDQYGCGEVPAISYECTKHNGLHINEEHVYLETLDDNNDEIINNKGRIVVTNLDNFVMPFIRYENGDTGTLLSEKCSCGLNSQLMGSIDGRTIDTIELINGSKVHGVFFTDILYELGINTNLISRFQIYQYESGGIEISLETDKQIPSDLIDNLKLELAKFVKSVSVKIVSHIPNEINGKFRYIKCQKKSD